MSNAWEWIDLSAAEFALAKATADRQYRENRARGRMDMRRRKDGDPRHTEALAFGAELAYCSKYGLAPLCFSHVAIKYDVVTKNGFRIDIKHTPIRSGRLLVTTKHDDVDYYCLTVSRPHDAAYQYSIRGYISVIDFWRDHDVRNLGYGPSACLPQSALIGPSSLGLKALMQLLHGEAGADQECN